MTVADMLTYQTLTEAERHSIPDHLKADMQKMFGNRMSSRRYIKGVLQ